MYFAKKIKLILRFCFSCLIGLVKLDFQKNQLLVFNYHNFNNSKNIYDEMYVSYKNFEKQIVFFKNKNLLISYNELLIMRLNDSKKKKILITIDDADFSVKKTIPIIQKYKIPIILFLPIGLLLDKNDINYYRSICLHHYFFINQYKNLELSKNDFFEEIMKHNIEELKKIIETLCKKNVKKDYIIKRKKIEFEFIKNLKKYPNITIGSHSMSHVMLSKIPENWLKWEINTSLEYIKKLKGNISIYSLPYGNYNSFSKNVIRSLIANKVQYIFTTTEINNNYNNLLLGRSFVMNSRRSFYLNGMINGSMYIVDKILFRVKNNYLY